MQNLRQKSSLALTNVRSAQDVSWCTWKGHASSAPPSPSLLASAAFLQAAPLLSKRGRAVCLQVPLPRHEHLEIDGDGVTLLEWRFYGSPPAAMRKECGWCGLRALLCLAELEGRRGLLLHRRDRSLVKPLVLLVKGSVDGRRTKAVDWCGFCARDPASRSLVTWAKRLTFSLSNQPPCLQRRSEDVVLEIFHCRCLAPQSLSHLQSLIPHTFLQRGRRVLCVSKNLSKFRVCPQLRSARLGQIRSMHAGPWQ